LSGRVSPELRHLQATLAAQLPYRQAAAAYKDEELVAVLQCAGLNRLSSSLDRVARWDRELTDDEQQCLVFTRILLLKPRWVVIDEALDALDDDARKRVISLFKDALKDAAIINIGRRVLHLIKDPHGRCFIPDCSVAFAGQPTASPAARPANPIG
jgi:vitamin B12/bleomycin/antimicrobial peptide transport system ATP-binding/permease protein